MTIDSLRNAESSEKVTGADVCGKGWPLCISRAGATTIENQQSPIALLGAIGVC